MSLELRVISNPTNGSVLLIMMGTLSREFGVVKGPLNVGPTIATGQFVSVTWAMQTRPLPSAWARGITSPGSIAPRTASGRRKIRADKFLFNLARRLIADLLSYTGVSSFAVYLT